MATLLESTGLFTDVFDFFLPFILVFAISYGILMKTQFISSRADVNGLISLALSLLVAFSGAGKFLSTITPFFAVFFIIIFLIFLLFLFFGVEKDFRTVLFKNTKITVFIVIICLLFIFYAIGTLYGGSFTPGAVTSGEGNQTVNYTVTQPPPGYESCPMTGPAAVSCLLGHPKVLSTIVVLGIMTIATFLIIYVPKPK